MESLRRLLVSPIVRHVLQWAAALGLVALWYFAAQAAMAAFVGVAPGPRARTHDLVAHLAVGAVLFARARNLVRFAVAATVLFTAFTVANALKVAVLGGPIMPDDFVSARNLFLLLDGWQLWAIAAMVAAPLGLLAWMFAWRTPRAWVAVASVAVATAAVLAHPEPTLRTLDARFGDWVWNQRGNFEARGLPVHLVQEAVRSRVRRDVAPAADEVGDVLAALGGYRPGKLVRVANAGIPLRNVHMIVLESFWDPKPLKAARLSADPLDPAFRKLWAATGHATVLSPVFGGYTANAEYEALCGFPVIQDAVFFEGRLRRDAPCLPRHLAEAGYASYASHPNAASFWNRVNAYRRIGFDTYWSERDFALDDMNREFLADASLYRQVLERIGPELDGPTPVFNYVLTYFGHLDYPLNERRPKVIRSKDGNPHVEAYANTMYYKSRELMAFLAELRRMDPDAVIVVFGDHLPFLGRNFAGYTDSGLLAASRGEFDDKMFRTLTATPLVVIDGRRGPLKTGEVPMYQLPALILELLGDRRDSVMKLTARTPDAARIRPLPGMHVVLDGKKVKACRDGESSDAGEACAASRAWLEAVTTLQRDVFSGAQHALRPPAGLRTAAANAAEAGARSAD